MAIITKIPRLNKFADKILKSVYKGQKGSPFKNVDDLGSHLILDKKILNLVLKLKKIKK